MFYTKHCTRCCFTVTRVYLCFVLLMLIATLQGNIYALYPRILLDLKSNVEKSKTVSTGSKLQLFTTVAARMSTFFEFFENTLRNKLQFTGIERHLR